jgi:hypothetical protein
MLSAFGLCFHALQTGSKHGNSFLPRRPRHRRLREPRLIGGLRLALDFPEFTFRFVRRSQSTVHSRVSVKNALPVAFVLGYLFLVFGV